MTYNVCSFSSARVCGSVLDKYCMANVVTLYAHSGWFMDSIYSLLRFHFTKMDHLYMLLYNLLYNLYITLSYI